MYLNIIVIYRQTTQPRQTQTLYSPHNLTLKKYATYSLLSSPHKLLTKVTHRLIRLSFVAILFCNTTLSPSSTIFLFSNNNINWATWFCPHTNKFLLHLSPTPTYYYSTCLHVLEYYHNLLQLNTVYGIYALMLHFLPTCVPKTWFPSCPQLLT